MSVSILYHTLCTSPHGFIPFIMSQVVSATFGTKNVICWYSQISVNIMPYLYMIGGHSITNIAQITQSYRLKLYIFNSYIRLSTSAFM